VTAAVDKPLQVDVDAAIEFLSAVTPAGSFGNVVAINAYSGAPTGIGFQQGKLDAVRDFIQHHQRENLYFSVNGLDRQIDKKPSKADISAMRWAYVDIDDLSDGVLRRLQNFELPPTLILFSGGGYQAFWQLDAPVRVDGNLAELEGVNKALIASLGGDRSAWNLDRVMRLPATVNWLSPTKRKRGRQLAATYIVEHHPERTYSIEQLQAIQCTPAPKDELRARAKKAGAADTSRSADLMRKVRAAINARWTDEQIHAALDGTDPHALDQNDPARAVQRAIDLVRRTPSNYLANDTGNAQRLVAQRGEDFHYCVETGEFHVWDGIRWAPDLRALRVTQLLKECNRTMWDEVKESADPKQQEARAKWAVRSQDNARLIAAISSVRSEPGVAIRQAQFDADPMLPGVQNGTVNLKTGKFQKADRKDYITKSVGCAFDPKARCPRFRKLLANMFAPAVAAYLQRVLGYILTGMTLEQAIFLLLGVTHAGKSVLIETIKALMGDYGCNARTELLMQHKQASKGGPSEEEARLSGRRFVSVNETIDGMRLNESLIKDLSGEDTVTARMLHKNSQEFLPQFKIMIRGNHKPNVSGDDAAIARRLKLLWVNSSVPTSKRDPKLKEKLRAELPGILNFAIEGCRLWQRDGLREPPEVSNATRAYLDEMDTLGLYLAERCRAEASAESTLDMIYSDYHRWIEDAGQFPLSKKRFSQKLIERGFKRKHTMSGSRISGIRLFDGARDDAKDDPQWANSLQRSKPKLRVVRP
jgi:P4 family phage/plasmid primase-like protien